MMRHIDNLENHVIVCGYGRVGRSAVKSLLGSKRQVVVIEWDAGKAAVLDELGLPYLLGDAWMKCCSRRASAGLGRAGVHRRRCAQPVYCSLRPGAECRFVHRHPLG